MKLDVTISEKLSDGGAMEKRLTFHCVDQMVVPSLVFDDIRQNMNEVLEKAREYNRKFKVKKD